MCDRQCRRRSASGRSQMQADWSEEIGQEFGSNCLVPASGRFLKHLNPRSLRFSLRRPSAFEAPAQTLLPAAMCFFRHRPDAILDELRCSRRPSVLQQFCDARSHTRKWLFPNYWIGDFISNSDHTMTLRRETATIPLEPGSWIGRVGSSLLQFSHFMCFSIVAVLTICSFEARHDRRSCHKFAFRVWLAFKDGSFFVITRIESVPDGMDYSV